MSPTRRAHTASAAADELKRNLSVARLENRRLLGEAKEALERQTAISEILRVISSSSADVQPVLDTIAVSAARFCGADHAGVALVRDDKAAVPASTKDALPIYYAYRDRAGSSAYEAPDLQRIAHKSVTARAIIEARLYNVADMETLDEGEYAAGKRYAREHGYRAFLAAPLLEDGRAIGAIQLRRSTVGAFSAQEVELVQTFATQAVIAIQNVRLFRAVERQRKELTRFVSAQVASLLTSDEGQRLLDGHRRAITVLFCDLRNFSAFSETAEPEEVLGVLREYHAAMGELIVAHGGTLEHFAGDGMMVFFNDPVPVADHELGAVRLAAAMRDRFESMAQVWHRKGYKLGLGIGAAVGHATLGRIGFEGRYDYGAIGNVVIVASRLSGEAKAGQILLTQRLHAAVEKYVEAEVIGELSLKGQTRPTTAFNVTAMRTTD